MTEHAMTIGAVTTQRDIGALRDLLREYAASLGIDLSYQNFDAELASLPGEYTPPRGQLLLARDHRGEPVGCVALRPLPETGACEIKRLYVRPQAQGHALGRRLALAIVAEAKSAGYSLIRLDTLASMTAAQKLYTSLGFRQTGPYYPSPVPGTLYLAFDI